MRCLVLSIAPGPPAASQALEAIFRLIFQKSSSGADWVYTSNLTPPAAGSAAIALERRSMMRPVVLFVLILVFGPAFLCAGPIYGSIFFNGKALRGASITITCGGRPAATGSTVDDGSYRILVQPSGRCTFSVTNPAFPGAANGEVVSSSAATQYNFAVVKGGDGGYELRRQ